MQVWLIPIEDERVGAQVKLWNPLRTRAIPERFCSGDSLQRGAISSVWTFYLTLFGDDCLTMRHKNCPVHSHVYAHYSVKLWEQILRKTAELLASKFRMM